MGKAIANYHTSWQSNYGSATLPQRISLLIGVNLAQTIIDQELALYELLSPKYRRHIRLRAWGATTTRR